MDQQLMNYVFPLALMAFFLYRFWRFRRMKSLLPGLLKEGGVIVDVRSSGEFAGGSGAGSVNIPLDQLARRAGELNPALPVILCCASGTRSGMAMGILKSKGFRKVYNAGPWTNTVSRG